VTAYVVRLCASYLVDAANDASTKALTMDVDVNGPVPCRQYSDTFVARELAKAPVSHFHGPLAIGPVTINWAIPPGLALRRGAAGTDLQANVGTLDAARRCWVVVATHEGTDKCLSPDGVRPIADIAFPASALCGLPIWRRYVLGRVC
jgi:hypothetical protein